jgi:hypothetical protein
MSARTPLALAIALALGGCSIFFDTDKRTAGRDDDAGTDSGVMDSDVPDGDSGVMDATPDAPPPMGPRTICDIGAPSQGPTRRETGPVEISVALTQRGGIAQMAHASPPAANLTTTPFDALDTTDTWDVASVLDRQVGTYIAPASMAIRRYDDMQVGIVVSGFAEIETYSGFAVGSSATRDGFAGLALTADGDPGTGRPVSTHIGQGLDLRAVFVEDNRTFLEGVGMGSIKTSGEGYGSIDLRGATATGPVFVTGSAGRLAVFAEMNGFLLWDGISAAPTLYADAAVTRLPYTLDIANPRGDVYVVTYYAPTISRITHQRFVCSFAADSGQLIDCGEPEETVDELDVPERLRLATHRVEGVGFAHVVAFSDGSDVIVRAELVDENLDLIEESSGEALIMELGALPSTNAQAIDVDTWVQGDEVFVLVGVTTSPPGGMPELTMFTWRARLCPLAD